MLFVPVVIAYRAAVGGQQRLLTSPLLRAMQSHAGVPEEVFLTVPPSARAKGARGTSMPYISHVFAPLTSDTAPCHRAGGGHLRLCSSCE